MDQIKLYNILRTDLHLTDDKAADFVSAIGKTAERELDAKIQTLATKDDIQAAKDEIYKLALDTKKDMQVLNDKLSNKIYLVGFYQLLAIVGSLLAIVRFIK